MVQTFSYVVFTEAVTSHIVLSASLEENSNYAYCSLPSGQGRARPQGSEIIAVVNLALKPAFDQALAILNIEDEKRIRPLPIQAYTNDIAMITTNYEIILEMLRSSEPLFNAAGLKVKSSKCALLYDRRSGNNWYKGKYDQRPSIKYKVKR